MITEKQANNQTNKVLDSIPQIIINEVKKCAKERKAILFEAMSFSEDIIEKQNALVDLAYQVFIDPKKGDASEQNKEWFPLKTIDCLPLKKKEVQEQITSFLHNSFGFCILYIKGLKSGDDDIWADICKLKREIENRKWQEQTIVNLTEDEIAKIKNGKKLYYDRNKHKITSKAEGDLIEIRETPDEDETVLYYKYISRELIIVSSLEKLPERLKWVQNEFKLISLDGEETIVEPVVGTAESKEQQGEGIEQGDEDASPHLDGNIFRYRGGKWEIAFRGEPIYPTDKEGFNYIAYVLSNAQNQIHNYTLYQEVKDLGTGLVTEDQKFDAGLYPESFTKKKTSEKDEGEDYKNYKEMVAALDKNDEELGEEKIELKTNNRDASRVGKIDAQLIKNMAIRKSIAKDFESGGKHGIAKAKIVSNVYMGIYRSLQTIKKEHPSLHEHFKAFFHNGKEFTSYFPDSPFLWQTNYS